MKVINVRSFKKFDPLSFVSDLRNFPWDPIYLFDSPEDAWFAMNEFLKLRTLKTNMLLYVPSAYAVLNLFGWSPG